MATFSRTWWGRRFLAALESFTSPARLARGRPYATGGRVEDYRIRDGTVTARVRGRINPYYGVYEEPHYTTKVALKPFAAGDWTKAAAHVATRADLVIPLLLREMPDAIDDAFTGLGLHLLPAKAADFVTSCSCPDWENPCKHVAAVTYLLAADLDHDPFLLFELRGLPRQRLRDELAQSALGRALAADLAATETAPTPAASFFTDPPDDPTADALPYKAFWGGAQRLPPPPPAPTPPVVPALLIKTQGDLPAFWHNDASFIGAMEELYERVRTKSRGLR